MSGIYKSKLNQIELNATDVFKSKLLLTMSQKVKRIVLFGSRARGQGSQESDIDILLIVDKENLAAWNEIQTISSDVCIEFDVFLSVKIIDLEYFEFSKNVDSPFIKNVLKDGVDIWRAA